MAVECLLCLSSGLTPQYRLDILRLLALPTGMHIQFRYGRDIIQEGLRKQLAENALRGSKILLAYVDCTDSARRTGGNCPIVPCRHAILEYSTTLASFSFLRLRLAQFAPCSDIESFQKQVSRDRPHWSETPEGSQLTGHWCFESSVGEQACQRGDSTEAWQQVIRQLWKRTDFNQELFFFTVVGLYPRVASEPSEPVRPESGEFILKSEKDYELRMFHFHPDGDSHTMAKNAGMLKVEVAKPHLESVTTPTLPVDSPYDLKAFHFRSARPNKVEFTSIVVRVENRTDGKPSESQPELYLPAKVKPSWFKSGLSMVLLAVLLFAQQYIAASAKGAVDLSSLLALLALAIGTALLVVFGLRKPL